VAERAYYFACLALGWLLRSARYTQAPIVDADTEALVRKRRAYYSPLLIWLGGLVVTVLNTGTRVLSQQEWEERERLIYQTVYGTSIQVEADGTLVLPCLAGRTLAIVLENPALEDSTRKTAIESAVAALAAFHRQGFTHADAMAENVLIDRSCVARWFDFETIHDSRRPMTWRRADDLRALLVTCLIRTVPEKRDGTLQLILDAYADEDVTRVLAMSFTSVWRRPLSFHLAQAALPFKSFREIGRWLQQRTGGVRQ
jgi:hypothetical protein